MKVISSLIGLMGLMAVMVQAGVPTLPGECPDLKPVQNIDSEKLSGDWFEHYHGKVGDEDPKIPTEKCEKKSLISKPDGYDVTMTYLDGEDNKKTHNSKATKVDGSGAKYSATSDDLPKGLQMFVNILETDYTNLMVSCACVTDGTKHLFKVGVYSRGKTIDDGDVTKAKEAFKSRDIKVDLEPVQQTCD